MDEDDDDLYGGYDESENPSTANASNHVSNNEQAIKHEDDDGEGEDIEEDDSDSVRA